MGEILSIQSAKEFLIQLIDAYRTKIINSSNIKDLEAKSALDLHSPLQVSVLWLKSTTNDLQVFLTNHYKNQPDKKIRIFGPYKIDEENFNDEIKIIFRENGLFIQEGDNHSTKLRLYLERMIRGTIKTLFREPRNDRLVSGLLGQSSDYTIFDGNLFKCELESVVNFIQQEKIKEENLEKSVKKHTTLPQMEEYLAVFIQPPHLVR